MRTARAAPTPALIALGTFAAGVFPVAMLQWLGHKHVDFSSMTHFAGVGLTALLATVAAIAITIVGARRGDGRTIVLGTAFAVMAALLAVHGIATPGMLVGMNGVVAFSGAATLPIGGAVLALSTLPAFSRPRSIRPLLVLEGALIAAITALGTAGMVFPDLVPAVPEEKSPPALITLAAGLTFFTVLGWRALRTYRLTRRASDLSVVIGIIWLAAAIVPALTLGPWDAGWWLGHAFELVGILLVGAPVAIDLTRDAPSRPLAGDLRASELVLAEEAYLGSQVRALTRLLADRDTYTEEHTRRVALRAAQVGEQLGLPPERLRVLAAGGLLHDIGKLSVPDSILRKPGALSDAEYDVIREHPRRGHDLLAELGFPASVRALVLDHHERLDGSGYPRGLAVADVDLETRILAVCDVYDALISTRVYREAWTTERALRLLSGDERDRFDQRCVTALERLVTPGALPRATVASPEAAIVLAASAGGDAATSGR